MNNTKTSVKLTLDEMYLISAALNNDAIIYRDAAEDDIDDEEMFHYDMDCYRRRMALRKKIDELSDIASKSEV